MHFGGLNRIKEFSMKRNTLYIILIILSWAQIVCAQEGTLKWKYNTQDEIYYAPTIDLSGNIEIANLNAYFFCINTSGLLQWLLTNGIQPKFLIDTNNIIFLNHLQSLQAYYSNGTQKWSTMVYPNPAYIYSYVESIALGPDNTIYIGSDFDTTLRAFTPEGTQKWKINLL